jgi:hypothetical protein
MIPPNARNTSWKLKCLGYVMRLVILVAAYPWLALLKHGITQVPLFPNVLQVISICMLLPLFVVWNLIYLSVSHSMTMRKCLLCISVGVAPTLIKVTRVVINKHFKNEHLTNQACSIAALAAITPSIIILMTSSWKHQRRNLHEYH